MKLQEIFVYTIKSLPGSPLSSVPLVGDHLYSDRAYRITKEDGKVVNTKSEGRLTQIQFQTYPGGDLCLLAPGMDILRARYEDTEKLQQWLSSFLGYPVLFQGAMTEYYPDDDEASGPTLVSIATLKAVAEKFGWDVVETIERFRPNLIVDCESGEPFAEEQLVGKQFKLGQVVLEATNVCQRCIVPSRHPGTGAITSGFARRFSEWRKQSAPAWSQYFDHFYRLTLNTKVIVDQSGNILRVGDQSQDLD